MEELAGRIEKDKIANLLQYLQMNNSSGCLSLNHPQGAQAYIFIEDGEPVHISLGKPGTQGLKTDVEALALIFTWGKGRYAFKDKIPSPVKTIKSKLGKLLMSATVALDEKNRSGRKMLFGGSVLVAQTKPIEPVDSLTKNILSQLDGIINLEEVAEKLGEPLDEIISKVEDLLTNSLVAVKVATIGNGFLPELEHIVVNIMGPIGGVVVDDVLDTFGVTDNKLPVRIIDDILQEIKTELRNEEWRKKFEHDSQVLLSNHGLKF